MVQAVDCRASDGCSDIVSAGAAVDCEDQVVACPYAPTVRAPYLLAPSDTAQRARPSGDHLCDALPKITRQVEAGPSWPSRAMPLAVWWCISISSALAVLLLVVL